jgi:hypothetical protein
MSRKKFMGGIVVAGIMAGLVAGAATARAVSPKVPVLTSLTDAKWTPLMKGSPLPALAPIRGDFGKGPYEAYLKLPAGFVSPVHSHTDDYWAVLVQGKMTHWAADGGSEKDSKVLSPGDLTFMPGKSDHVTKCFPGQDCIVVIAQRVKFDFIPGKGPSGT